MKPTFEGTSIEEAKVFVQGQLTVGCVCPACGQYAKIYKRALYSTLAYCLCLIAQHLRKNPTHNWIHVAQFLVQAKGDSSIAGGDVVKLRYWGLLEAVDGEDRLGRWRITPLGEAFVRGQVAVPKYVYLYNGEAMKLSEETVTIREALGTRFDLETLLAEATP